MFVLIDALQRIEAAATDALAAVNDGSLSNAEARQVLGVCKPAMAALSAARTAAARVIAGTERHGDGGAQVLADAAGLTRHEAHSQIKTAETLQAAPAVRDAVESGRVSPSNAKRLAEAISKTGAGAVESDTELLAKAESLRPEQFNREARRWTADHQDDGGEADYRRMRARRYVRISDGDDGMMHLHGEFDPVTGQRIANRLNNAARRLHSADQMNRPKGDRRNYPQCLADALDDLTAGASNIAAASGTEGGSAGSSGKPTADICVVAHVSDETGRLIGELADGSRLPRSVLDELTCNAKITGAVFDRCGKAIWKSSTSRRANKTQRQILNAKWGGCFHCGANFTICQPHHIDPVSQGGHTHVKNLVPACWTCHQLIHRDGWQIHKRPDGNHTLHPPQRITYGPAHAPEHAPLVVAVPPLFTTSLGHELEPEPPASADTAPPERRLTVSPQSASSSKHPDSDTADTSRPEAAPEPPAAGQTPCKRPGPATVRATLHAARAARAAREGPG